MPIIQKRVRSFSPYRYNIQYARMGEGPNQKPHPYINAAVLEEDVYVLSKKDPHWFAYIVNSIYYNSDDECKLNLESIESKIIIVDGSKKLSESMNSSLKQFDIAYQKDEVNLKSYEWDNSTVAIKNPYDEYSDCFVLGNGEYLKIKKKITDDSIVIKFEDGFSADRYSNLKAVIYAINPHTTNFKMKEIPVDSIEHNASNYIYFENAFNTNKVVPLVFNSDGFASTFENPDLTPVRVVLKNSDGLISGEGADATLNISKVLLYSHNKDTFSCTLRQGVNTENVAWDGNSAIVRHNINGVVNIIIDDTYDRNPQFRAYSVNEGTVKIDFINSSKYEVCNLIVFKVG